MSRSEYGNEELSNIRSAYQACVELVDDHLVVNDQSRDEVPGYLHERSVTVRYNFLEQPKKLSTLPYTSALERSSVIAFQRLEREQPYRKIELLDPFRSLGGYTLLLLGMKDQAHYNPDIPDMAARGEGIDYTEARPFDHAELTGDVLSLAETIRDISRRGKLVPISFEDIQAMYGMQGDIENL